jgi:hypothetical protein
VFRVLLVVVGNGGDRNEMEMEWRISSAGSRRALRRNRKRGLTKDAFVKEFDERFSAQLTQNERMKTLKKTKSTQTDADFVDFGLGSVTRPERPRTPHRPGQGQRRSAGRKKRLTIECQVYNACRSDYEDEDENDDDDGVRKEEANYRRTTDC